MSAISLTSTKRRKIKLRMAVEQGFRCAYCLVRCTYEELTFDHVVPVSLGGASGALHNLVLACAACNEAKGVELWAPKLAPKNFCPPLRMSYVNPTCYVRDEEIVG